MRIHRPACPQEVSFVLTNGWLVYSKIKPDEGQRIDFCFATAQGTLDSMDNILYKSTRFKSTAIILWRPAKEPAPKQPSPPDTPQTGEVRIDNMGWPWKWDGERWLRPKWVAFADAMPPRNIRIDVLAPVHESRDEPHGDITKNVPSTDRAYVGNPKYRWWSVAGGD